MLFWLWYKIIYIYMGKLEYFTNLTELINAILGEDSLIHHDPQCSMYGIFANIYHLFVTRM